MRLISEPIYSKAKQESGYQANLADAVISHDSYHSRTVYADIALIKVSTGFELSYFES